MSIYDVRNHKSYYYINLILKWSLNRLCLLFIHSPLIDLNLNFRLLFIQVILLSTSQFLP